jgi:hypothetical protein
MTKQLEVPVRIMLALFDSFVACILNYSCELWGYLKAENLEKVHKKFLKWILKVKMSTCTSALYGEFGRYPLYIVRHIRIVKYFLRIFDEKRNNCIMYTV